MELIKFIEAGEPIFYKEAKNRTALAQEVQNKLTALGLLDPFIPATSVEQAFAPAGSHPNTSSLEVYQETFDALKFFGRLTNIPIGGAFTRELAEKILNADPETFLPLQLSETGTESDSDRLAKRILRFMQQNGYWIARSPEMLNIVYLEGANENGLKNPDLDDEWNDRRIIIRVNAGGVPQILLNVEATTEPTKEFARTDKAKKRGESRPGAQDGGVSRVAFGQYKAWRMGFHQGKQWHPALRQAGPLRIFRDRNADGLRNDVVTIENGIGINQHSTRPNETFRRVGNWSEGCLVGRHWSDHENFLAWLQTDIRYVQNSNYLFMSTVLNGEKFSDTMMV